VATTNSAFNVTLKSALVGSAVLAAGVVQAVSKEVANREQTDTGSTRLDTHPNADLAVAGFAKNGAASVALTGTTPVTLSLLDLTSNTTSSAGDTVFATWNVLNMFNTGGADVTIAQAGSNPARLGLAGTNPTLTIPAGSRVSLESVAGLGVDSTHKSFVVTPTSGGSFAFSVGGA
jgi:hypothetical protein